MAPDPATRASDRTLHVRRLEIVEESRLILRMSHEVLSSRSGGPDRSRLVSAERPRPSASSRGGEKSRGSGLQAWRQKGRLASTCAGALRAPSRSRVSAAHGRVAVRVRCRRRGGSLLRVAAVSSERSLRQLCFHVPRLPANPSLERARQARRSAQDRSAALRSFCLAGEW